MTASSIFGTGIGVGSRGNLIRLLAMPSTNARRHSENVTGIASVIGMQFIYGSGKTVILRREAIKLTKGAASNVADRMKEDHQMSAQKLCCSANLYHLFPVFLLGAKALLRHPDWFGRESKNELYANPGVDHISTPAARLFITLGSTTSIEGSVFFDYLLPIFRTATGLDGIDGRELFSRRIHTL